MLRDFQTIFVYDYKIVFIFKTLQNCIKVRVSYFCPLFYDNVRYQKKRQKRETSR